MAPVTHPSTAILVVDDDAGKLVALETVLAPLGHEVVRACSGREALRFLLQREFAVILLDVRMAEMDGFETAELIRRRRQSERTPIIFVTAYGEAEADIRRGYALGAVDFIFAPVVPEVLRAKVSVLVDLYRKTEEARQQAERLRQLEKREHRRRLREAQRARDQAETRFASVLDVAEDGIVVVDEHERIVLFNKGAERIFGRESTGVIGEPFDLLVPGGVGAMGPPTGANGGTPTGRREVTARRHDGSSFPAEVSVTSFPQGEGAATAVILHDISERKAAEENVRRLNADLDRRLSAGIDMVAHLAASLDPDEVLSRLLVRVTQAANADQGVLLRVTDGGLVVEGGYDDRGDAAPPPPRGLHQQPLVQKAIIERVPVIGGGFDPAFSDRAERKLVAEMRQTVVLPLVVGDDVVAVLVLVRRQDRPFSQSDADMLRLIGDVAIVALRNAELFSDARKASSAKSEFLRMAAHELRTPMGVIRGYVSMIGDGTFGPVPDGWDRPLDVISAKAGELTGLIDELLVAARMEAGVVPLALESLDLRDAVMKAAERAEGRAVLLGGRIECDLGEHPGVVSTDAEHLARILDNLVNNALTYSVGPPSVHLSIRHGPAPAIAVTDRGLGIPEEMQERVFERFFRVNDPAVGFPPGTGLGLYIGRELADRLGGRLELESSRAGEGSTFVLHLDGAQPERSVPGARAEAAALEADMTAQPG